MQETCLDRMVVAPLVLLYLQARWAFFNSHWKEALS